LNVIAIHGKLRAYAIDMLVEPFVMPGNTLLLEDPVFSVDRIVQRFFFGQFQAEAFPKQFFA
jgi:hypothetical protein